MKYPMMIATALLAGCGGGDDKAGSNDAAAPGMAAMPGMEGMEGMPGMAMGVDSVPSIRLNASQAALSGVTFAVARSAPVERTVRAVATATSSERGRVIVNARVTGWVERLMANETGRPVRRGDALLELYAPELVSAQEELLLARRLPAAAGRDALVASARRRLSLWDISADQIERLEQTGEVQRRLIIRAPASGSILEKNVVEGQMVRAGDPLYTLVDLSTIWVEPAIFESDIAQIQVGQSAEITFDGLPGRQFDGKVTFLYPELDRRTRTLRVRVEVANRDGAIRPMMFGVARIHGRGVTGVVVPLQAVLPTGTRDLAFIVRGGAVFPTPVVVGARGDSTVIIVTGVAVGDTVIASATFLFDSESQLGAAMAGIMLNMGMGLDMGGMKMDGMNMDAADTTAKPDSMAGMRMGPPARTPERRP